MRKFLLTLRNTKITYVFFYFSFIVVTLVAVFFKEPSIVYVKPLIPISLIAIQIVHGKTVNPYYILNMLILVINDTLVYLSFVTYFDQVAATIILFYGLNTFLLKDYIKLSDVRIKKLMSFPIVISLLLMSYLTFSISSLVLPNLIDSVVLFFMILIALLFFVGTCFFIYIIDKYQGNFRLFVSASCCLFVNAILLINYFYFHARVFTVLTNVAEITGLYFFLRFLIEVKPIKITPKKEDYF